MGILNEKRCNPLVYKEYNTLKKWTNSNEIYKSLQITFGDLFEYIVRIAYYIDNPTIRTNDIFLRIRTEMKDAVGMCFTGKMNRLVNSLVGIVDGVIVGLSTIEQTNMEIQSIVKRLQNKSITVHEAHTTMQELFDTVSDDVMAKEIKQSYLYALEDYVD